VNAVPIPAVGKRYLDAVARCLRRAVLLAALGVHTQIPASPVHAGNARRPKICLVLSGGGARGAAHVGVLKVLEEYRVPVDCIAGTSMGALVGGSYASGTTVPELEEIMNSISTELLFNETPPRQVLSMQRRRDDYGLFVGPELGIGQGKLWFAKGLVTGVQLESVLRRLSKVRGPHDFDDLPIPFRAVATDLVTGHAVVFHRGELANVMRATMSVPGAVAPAEFDGMMLVDGGLTRNLPVEAARAMGADIIIAVNVGTPLLNRQQLSGVLGVTTQMIEILTEQNVQASLAALTDTDILITPALGGHSAGDFDNLAKIAPIGEAAARKVADRLAALSLPPEAYATLRRAQQRAVAPDQMPADEVRFGALRHVNPQRLQALMATRVGQPIAQEALDRDMLLIQGTGDFEHVSYRFIEERGKRVLVVDAVEKPWGNNSLRFGLGLFSDFKSDAFFNVAGSLRTRWINSLGAEWRLDLQAGRNSGVTSEFYQPFAVSGQFFVVPRVQLLRRFFDLYKGDERIARYVLVSAHAEVAAGALLGNLGDVRVGVLRGTVRPTLDTGPESLTPGPSNVSQSALIARLTLDQLDSVHFPRSGWRCRASLFRAVGWLGGDDAYAKWDADAIAAYTSGSHSISLTLRSGGRVGSNPLPRYDLVEWGGFLEQSGYASGQLLGDSLSFGRIMYYRRVLRGTLLEGAYLGLSLEAGKVGNPLVARNPDGWLESAAFFVAVDTPIGPTYFGYGRAWDGTGSFYFLVGHPL
jgi:NTE family protein